MVNVIVTNLTISLSYLGIFHSPLEMSRLDSIRSVHSSAKYAFHKFLANLFLFGIYPLGLSYKYNSLFNTNATCEPIYVLYLLVLGTFLSPSEY